MEEDYAGNQQALLPPEKPEKRGAEKDEINRE